jgi:ribosome-associated protein
MLGINERIHIPDDEFTWTFARSGGPGGQNVNKVASKAVLHWNVAESISLPAHVKTRLRTLQRRRFTKEGVLVLVSQRYRDQERNRQDCLEKLQVMVREATIIPRARRATRPTRGSREARLHAKKHRSAIKTGRRADHQDD